MAFDHEKREALRLLRTIELAELDTADTFQLVEKADPALVHLVFTWLRKAYATHSAASGVVGRLVELSRRYPHVAEIAHEGSQDVVVEWFEENHDYGDFSAEEFIDLIVEKLEG